MSQSPELILANWLAGAFKSASNADNAFLSTFWRSLTTQFPAASDKKILEDFKNNPANAQLRNRFAAMLKSRAASNNTFRQLLERAALGLVVQKNAAYKAKSKPDINPSLTFDNKDNTKKSVTPPIPKKDIPKKPTAKVKTQPATKPSGLGKGAGTSSAFPIPGSVTGKTSGFDIGSGGSKPLSLPDPFGNNTSVGKGMGTSATPQPSAKKAAAVKKGSIKKSAAPPIPRKDAPKKKAAVKASLAKPSAAKPAAKPALSEATASGEITTPSPAQPSPQVNEAPVTRSFKKPGTTTKSNPVTRSFHEVLKKPLPPRSPFDLLVSGEDADVQPKANLVTCHFRAEINEQLTLNRPAVAELVISREELAEAVSAATAAATGTVDENVQLTVRAHGVLNMQIEGNASQTVPVPSPGTPASLLFNCRPTHEGKCSMAISVWQAHALICELELFVSCITGNASQKKAEVTASASTVKPYRFPATQLRIREKQSGNDYYYEFEMFAPELGVNDVFPSKALNTDREKYIATLYSQIENLWKKVAYDPVAFENQLRNFGSDLFLTLLPVEMQRILYDNAAKITSIQVMSSEPFIPWELVLVRNPNTDEPVSANDKFLCEFGLIRWLHKWIPAETLPVRKGRARFVIPDYIRKSSTLKASGSERKLLEDLFSAEEIKPDPEEIKNILKQRGSTDLLHFCCHGQSANFESNYAELIISERKLEDKVYAVTLNQADIESVGKIVDAENSRPIVVLNACQGSRQAEKLTGFGGFAKAFLNAGAGLFVGALWNIEDKGALIFIEEFYNQLLAGKPIAMAANAARQKTRANEGATWLAYTVYAHPDAILVFPDNP